MKKDEKVLCLNRDKLPPSWVGKKTVLPLTLPGFIEQCTKSGYKFINRDQAEDDPSKKQVIPYILLQTHDLSQTAIYHRKGSEKRLHKLWSLGIGGHINPVDSKTANTPFKDILLEGMRRELKEELRERPEQDREVFSGIINEDKTGVGSVHLGAVFRILTRTPGAYVPGPELFRFQWVKTKDLHLYETEYWSELALALIGKTAQPTSG